MPLTTYYDMCNDLVTLADELYNRAGALRDAAEGREKDIFNHCRGVMGELSGKLRQFRDSLPTDRADMDLKGWKRNVITLGE